MSFDPSSGAFRLMYRANRRLRVPTVIYIPVAIHYPAATVRP